METTLDMQTMEAGEPGALFLEIERYLAAVELFRAEGHEPVWAGEAVWVDETEDEQAEAA